jgi:hypothetical protein
MATDSCSEVGCEEFPEVTRHLGHLSQSSTVTPDCASDPENLLLARGQDFRLPAEAVRDQALKVGGLLSDKMFGRRSPTASRFGLARLLAARLITSQ